jgi:hypothetical protein
MSTHPMGTRWLVPISIPPGDRFEPHYHLSTYPMGTRWHAPTAKPPGGHLELH